MVDKQLISSCFSRMAPEYNESAFLQQEIGARLLDNLDLMAIDPKVVLDLGAGTGQASGELLQRYRKSQVIAADFSIEMLQQVPQPRFRHKPVRLCADAELLPLMDDCVDLVFSNLMLQWCDPLLSCLQEVKRTMKAGGLFLFSTFGPDTLVELRTAWQEANGEDYMHPFMDMHDIGDALISVGLTEPVIEMEKLNVNYSGVMKLMQDIQCIGASNTMQQHTQKPTEKQALDAMEKIYREKFASGDSLPATFEVIYGHAWLDQRDRGGSIMPAIKITQVGKYVS